ncbi:zinc ABC transporter permease AztB [Arthrobacter glacialis]|uniref:ABC transporter permease n=1 Tax=Arthrobacter glacialis TaxID=1664 RepID=A0A2S4A1W6_ARTGL|nr:zinc ABC transporter permease AztB [Arthrobacter glacialis]POH61280.1 ABC transporter permease [Arthrobacter glacialis]POH75428.1 ABC transporter permease [Arthrobacter glacialis]
MDWLLEPFDVSFIQRALIGGFAVALLCAMVGTWVVLRGMAFLGDAMSHGMLPGIAVALLLGGNPVVGAAVSAAAMAFGVSAMSRHRRLTHDTSIGLLFVGMLAAGVIIISRSRSFAVDLTGILFGDILAVKFSDIWLLCGILAATALVAAIFHRPFTALAFDARKAATLGMRPDLAATVLLLLVTAAMAGSFQVVGTLLVFGLLIAPPAAALPWAKSIPAVMGVAAVLGCVSVMVGILLSWHARTAAGATIAATAVALFFISSAIKAAWPLLRQRRCSPAVPTSADTKPAPTT